MIPLMRNTFINEEETRKALAEFILKAPRFSMGDKCAEFEKQFSKYQNRKFSILFNSGASANLALLQACMNMELLKTGASIGFSALTWATNVMPIMQLGCSPIPVDCSRYTLNSMSQQLEMRLKEVKLDAFFITNALGFAADLGNIREICKKNKILLLEDNCEALGTDLPDGRTGNFGLASTFSFFVAHHMSTIEGGMVCTDDPLLAEMLQMVRANGWDRNLQLHQQIRLRASNGVKNEFEAKYTFYDLAYNLRPTEITGFIGKYQLQFLEQNISRRNEIFKTIEGAIRNNPDLIALDRSHIKRLSSFGIPILCKSPEIRDAYTARFTDAEVEIRPMIAGNIQIQPFYKKYVSREFSLPETEFLHNCGFYCGNYPELKNEEVAILKQCVTGQSDSDELDISAGSPIIHN